jgi:ubiquinol-cytochrome c reductase cytochrome b subunit
LSASPEAEDRDDARRPAALAAWLERRLGLRAWLGSRLPAVPASRRAWLALGTILVFFFALQIATGILLLFHFSPDPELAFDSVRRIMREVPYGWLVRLVHAHGANLLVAGIFAHLVATAWTGAYKAPRELHWWTGCVLLLLGLGAALTGYILPWSQLSYWATTIVTSTLGYLPVVGDDLVAFVRGGERVGSATFRRAFAAHVALLPFAMLGLVALHVALARRTGLAPRPRRGSATPALASEEAAPARRAAPLEAAAAVAGAFAVLVAFVVFAPNAFFPPESFAPANPLETPPGVKPEWYFLWLYELPRLFSEEVALALQGLAVAALFALPLLDPGPRRHPRDRPFVAAAIVAGAAAWLALTVLGHRE